MNSEENKEIKAEEIAEDEALKQEETADVSDEAVKEEIAGQPESEQEQAEEPAQDEAGAEVTDEDPADKAEGDDEQMTDITVAAEMPEPEKKKKKTFILQPAVIVSLCIVLLAVLGYFVFTFFFLHEPEGVIWSYEFNDATYYFEFKEDGTFKAYVGSVELTSEYEKINTDGETSVKIKANIVSFYGDETATYTITGSRILNNQEMTVTYDEDRTFTMTQVKEIPNPLELPSEFTADEDLVGKWICNYMGYEYCVAEFREDGTLAISYPLNGVTYNGTYTLEGENVNFTYYIYDYVVEPIPYSLDGDALTFMKMDFVKEGTESTSDEAFNSIVSFEE